MDAQDVLVVVHVQKTAGTSLEKFLVRHLNISEPCVCGEKKRCVCRRPGRDPASNESWLFSRYSTGWVCGLHADYTELEIEGCVDATLNRLERRRQARRRHFYVTMLREPRARFISEYAHVARGATWSSSRHVCNGRAPAVDELVPCYDSMQGWENVTMDRFLACPSNLAFNRQTRMLADLTLVGCYARTLDGRSREERDRAMLASAKANLRRFAFFGLQERMADTQWMFEKVFDLKFTRSLAEWTRWKSNGTVVNDQQIATIDARNALDAELYRFAVQLFDSRLQRLRSAEAGRHAQQTDNAILERAEEGGGALEN